jgi:16S rRNA (cytosine1402-N4)-methyltransferase
MDQHQSLTAATIVNSYDQSDLADLLRDYGEEPKSKQIAKLIVEARPLNSTEELAMVVAKAWPGHSRTHPATRTFQAIRIAVNDELGLLERSLPLWVQLLKPAGRIVVISFHSLEDRIVKQALQLVSGNRYDADIQLLTKKPVTAASHEVVHNPRARSAKLRAAVKTKKKGNFNAYSGKK